MPTAEQVRAALEDVPIGEELIIVVGGGREVTGRFAGIREARSSSRMLSATGSLTDVERVSTEIVSEGPE